MAEKKKQEVPKSQIDKEIELPSGKKATIKKGKGRHVMMATKMAEGDPGKIIPCIMHYLVLIDGEKQTLEQLEDLDMKDYFRLQTEFTDINF